MVIAMISICLGITGFTYSGLNTPNHVDLSPTFAGTIFGLTNMIGNIPGFLAPQTVGIMIENHEHEVAAWAPVWYTALGCKNKDFLRVTVTQIFYRCYCLFRFLGNAKGYSY